MEPAQRVTSISGELIDPTRNLVGVAVRGLAVAVLSGTGVVSLVLLGVRLLMAGAVPSDRPDTGAPFLLLVFGVFGAAVIAAATAWRGLAPLSPYRRGTLSMVAGFGALVGALVATPIYHFLGQPGLIGLALACVGAAGWLGRRRPVPASPA